MQHKRRALLACEGGAGRGHVVTLRSVAKALQDKFVFDAALCRLEYASEISSYCEAVYQSAYLPYDATPRSGPDSVRTATWGEFMGDLGFRDPAFLAMQIGWWRETMRTRRISLVIADYAPCALLAARSWGIPCAGIGTGYGLPPPSLKQFPILLPEYDKKLYDEREMVDAVNRAGAPLGVPHIEHLPQVYQCDEQLHRSLPLLDPYRAHRTAPPVPPVADLATSIAQDGEEIFIYFSTTERENAQLMDAIVSLAAPVRMFMPNIDDALAARMTAAGVIIERQPVPVDEIARRTRLLLNSAQSGIASLGLAAGLPQVCFPQHLEQLYVARQIADAGAGVSVGRSATTDEISTTIKTAYHDASLSARAREFSAEVRPYFAQDVDAIIRRRLERL
jgi:UDP:flavonoid glycosyltransferase YjiC (YdhE family)